MMYFPLILTHDMVSYVGCLGYCCDTDATCEIMKVLSKQLKQGEVR